MSKHQPPLRLPRRASDAHKGDFGRVALVGGSRGMTGAISLSSVAALCTGSGLVTAIVPDRCLESVAGFHPCLMTMPLTDDDAGYFGIDAAKQLTPTIAKCDAIGCGPGMTTHLGSQRIVERLVQHCQRRGEPGASVVLDADAINALAQLNWASRPERVQSTLVLTPHPGELQRLSGASANDRPAQIEAAQRMAIACGVIVVVKGGPTIVVDEQRTWANSTGNPGMATAGCGDVLTGVITSLLGQGLSGWDAARLGVWIHGLAGDRAADRLGMHGMTALDLLDEIPLAVKEAVEG